MTLGMALQEFVRPAGHHITLPPEARVNNPPQRGTPSPHLARLITLENDSSGLRRALARIRYASSSTESVFVALHRHWDDVNLAAGERS